MAKPGSSSCRPLLQGMMLLALLLLASIQAGGQVSMGEKFGEKFEDLVKKGEEFLHKNLWDVVVKRGPEIALTGLRKKPGWKDFSDGAKKGLKVHKYLCKAQGWMDKQNPGGASGTPPYYIDILGELSTFSYSVTSEGRGNSVVVCGRSAQPQAPAAGTGATLLPSRYPPNVRITGIRVGLEELTVQTPAPPASYLSNTQPYTYTYLESIVLYVRLREVVIRQINALNPGAIVFPPTDDKLCYAAPAPTLPRIAILLASDNVMQPMELGGENAVWYPEYSNSMVCLGIQRTMDLLILGRA